MPVTSSADASKFWGLLASNGAMPQIEEGVILKVYEELPLAEIAGLMDLALGPVIS